MSFVQRKIVRNGVGDFTGNNPVYLVIHSTANEGATAANHVTYWSGLEDTGVYAHAVVDWTEAYQCVEFTRKCYHCGNGNAYSIGIEICEPTSGNTTQFNACWSNAVTAVVEIMNTMGWTSTSCLKSHKYMSETFGGSDHTDPVSYFATYGKTFDDFVSAVATELASNSDTVTDSTGSGGTVNTGGGSSSSTSTSTTGGGNFCTIVANKLVNGNNLTVTYVGCKYSDGLVYFNDNDFYRVGANQPLQILSQHLTNGNRSWLFSTALTNITVYEFQTEGLMSLLFGAGSWSPSTAVGNGDTSNLAGTGVEDAVTWLITIANDDSHGYNQANISGTRWGPDYDCSSFIYEGFRVGGGFNLPVHVGNTSSMYKDFTACGFVWHTHVAPPSSVLLKGDIMWRDGHTECYIGNNQLVGAHYNEKGTTDGGQTGDQNGHEISVGSYYATDSNGNSWAGYFRYGG